jgi:hypothetical protein
VLRGDILSSRHSEEGECEHLRHSRCYTWSRGFRGVQGRTWHTGLLTCCWRIERSRVACVYGDDDDSDVVKLPGNRSAFQSCLKFAKVRVEPSSIGFNLDNTSYCIYNTISPSVVSSALLLAHISAIATTLISCSTLRLSRICLLLEKDTVSGKVTSRDHQGNVILQIGQSHHYSVGKAFGRHRRQDGGTAAGDGVHTSR